MLGSIPKALPSEPIHTDVKDCRPFCLIWQDRARRIVAAYDSQPNLSRQRHMNARPRHAGSIWAPCGRTVNRHHFDRSRRLSRFLVRHLFLLPQHLSIVCMYSQNNRNNEEVACD